MPKTIRLIAFGAGIVFLGLVIFNYAGYGFHLGSSGHFIENYSPGYPEAQTYHCMKEIHHLMKFQTMRMMLELLL